MGRGLNNSHSSCRSDYFYCTVYLHGSGLDLQPEVRASCFVFYTRFRAWGSRVTVSGCRYRSP